MNETSMHQLFRMEKRLTLQFNKTIKYEVSTALAHQQDSISSSVLTAMRESGAITPALNDSTVHTPDPHQQQAYLLQLLRDGRVNTAFQEVRKKDRGCNYSVCHLFWISHNIRHKLFQALTASDLSSVMLVCETVDPAQLFEQSPCPLKQPILLSLIQQLSADLTNKTEIKHR